MNGFEQTLKNAMLDMIPHVQLKPEDEIKASKDIIKKIDEILDIYLGKQDKRQGITMTLDVSITDRLSTARWYVSSRKTGVTDTERTLISHVKTDLEAALQTTNSFFEDNFKPYYQNMQTINMTKSLENIKNFNLD